MNTSSPQRLLIIDDHPLFRKGVLQLLKPAAEFNVIGEASGGREGCRLARELQPDLILLDLNMKDMNGIEVLKAIKATDSEARVVMLTVSDEAADLIAALRAGADGYLLKEMEPEDLVARLKDAAAGRLPLTERLTGLLAHAMRDDGRPKDLDEAGLTEQEGRILDLIAEGKSNKLIARELDITEGTVKVHVKHLLKKLNLRSRVEAAVWAIERKRGR
ncbi:LuxR family two component transcriptional regulator [Sulfuritortus calidifontis]|uniref:LuxR family two component transcriptional regulator n=1 Tax=Sulfuritortus calidifontis TaxID=1914471 RepID=A0A4R3K0P2_9PROT|nr:two-component system response regulator NarL [Sulfuritortus calidifontis]TCS73842.1 LuxR family two component transcriptional regulator [Sulfuritortus calidifontis]